MAVAVRPVKVKRKFTQHAPGSVLYQCGNTIVLCTAMVEQKVPPWLEGRGQGWITAEYSMLPSSTTSRKSRDRAGKVDGRTTEIQRLIGRSLRAVVDLQRLGERTIAIDCDVLQADGGTRTASITGAFIAMVDALNSEFGKASKGEYPLTDSIAAISVGIVDGKVELDLDYVKDVAAEVDMNVVMTGRGKFVELQGTGEEATFDDEQLAQMISKAKQGIKALTAIQRESLGKLWKFD